MVFVFVARYDIYSYEESNKVTAVAGMAGLGGVCGNDKQSIVEDAASYYVTTSITAHEIGHK